jgi:hypothetical protein
MMRLTELTEKGYYDLSKRLIRYYINPLLKKEREGTFNVLDLQFKDYHVEHMGNPLDLKEHIADLVRSYVNLETKQPDNKKSLMMIIRIRAIPYNSSNTGNYIARKEVPIYWE